MITSPVFKNSGGGERESNIELCRIIMMVLMIAHHYIVNSGVPQMYDYNNVSINMFFSQIYSAFGKTIINVFTIITGFYMINKNINRRKIFKLVFTACFYKYMFNIIFYLVGYAEFQIKDCFRHLLFIPLEFNRYYTSSMIVMMMFIPFINKFVKTLNKKTLGIFLTILLVLYSFIPTFLKHETFDFFIWLIICYIFGGYLQLYLQKYNNLKIGVFLSTISLLFIIISILVLNSYSEIRLFFGNSMYFTTNANKFSCLLLGIGIFMIFKNAKFKYIPFINLISSTTFGVLIIHTNSDYMRKFLWYDIFNVAGHYNKNFFIFFSLTVVAIVYAFSVMLELIKIKFIDNNIFKNKWFDKEYVI